MSFNICSLSGMPVIDPVISKKTGHIFEKRLIIKHIEVAGRCPITKHELCIDDLIQVKSDNSSLKMERPRSVLGTSMPGMFKELQSQWENILLETSGLKKELEVSRQELAHSLYQYDASTRVISKLIKERDMAREELTNYQNEFGNFDEEADLMGDEFNNMGISKELISRISEMTFKLISERKSRKITSDLYTNNQIEKFTCKSSFRPFANVKSNLIVNNPIGINCLDVNLLNTNYSNQIQYLIAGSNEGNVSFSQISDFKLNDTKIMKIHNRKINEIKFYPSNDILGFASCSDDNTAAFMIKTAQSENFEERYRIKNIHSDIITGVSFHPLEEYALLSSYDGYWSFHNLLKGVILHKELNGSHLTSVRFHPDGGLFATSQLDGVIKLWDITSQQEILKLADHGMERVNSISFSENGYYLASCGEEDQTVRVWDIRKNKVLKSLQLEEDNYVSKVEFDDSGNYLTLSGHKIGICDVKSMTLLNTQKYENHTNICTSTKFGNNTDSYIISSSLDGEIKIHA